MTSHTNGVWLETLTREKRAKEKWQAKYLSREEQTLAREEEQAEVAALKETMSSTQRRLSEKDASALRLEALASEVDDEPLQEAARPVSSYELCRRKVAEDVAMRRTLSHRFSGDLTTPSLLRDISPGMWASINSGYNFTSSQFTSSSHSAHSFNKAKGWGQQVDKKHHMRLDVMLAHADKCLQLGEKPFASGGMKLGKG